MSRPRLLDLFCGAGGCAKGYQRAGFYVVGVDIKAQPRYCGDEFHQGDALEFCREHGHEFDVIHASPICKKFTKMAALGKARNGSYPEHPDQVGPTRELLLSLNLPYIIENVPGAPLRNPILLCGRSFGLKVYRHRLFEWRGFRLVGRVHYPHGDKTPSAGNGVSPKGFISICGTGGVRGMTAPEIVTKWRDSMGIDWMTRDELSQAIPPAYTEFIGKQLVEQLQRAA